MTLRYLVFDFSEDAEGDGAGSFDALATVDPAHAPAVEQEVATVLDWARTHFPGGEGPLEDGGDWQHDLHITSEQADRRTLTAVGLTLAGTATFCQALRERFPEAT